MRSALRLFLGMGGALVALSGYYWTQDRAVSYWLLIAAVAMIVGVCAMALIELLEGGVRDDERDRSLRRRRGW